MSPLTSLDDLSSFYCPQPSDEKDPRCTVSCEPDVPSYPYFSSPTDCTKFCQCTTDGAPLAQECPEGLEWDQNTLTCNYPYEGNCRLQHECQEISFTASPSVHGGLDVSGDSVMCPQKGDVANENCTVTCEPGTQYYPHPRECGRFCQCSNGRPYDQPCPDGLHWDPALEVCNYPGAANCQLLPEC